jgi:hypothetical protein
MHFPKQVRDLVTTKQNIFIGSLLCFTLSGITPARAATFNYLGTTNVGGPTFQSLASFEPTPYSVFEFSVDTTATYTLTSTSTPWQNAISLYFTAFDPTSSFTNFQSASSQAPNISGVSISQLSYFLNPGITYLAVTSGLRATDFGNFSNSISGAGNVLTANATTSVPEPLTILGTLIGGTTAMRMRKKLADARKV